MPAHQFTAVFPGADMAHIYSFRPADKLADRLADKLTDRLEDNGAENTADNWVCVEIMISYNICTMEPPSVSIFVKSENQYTRNSGSLPKTRRFHLIFGFFYHFGDFPCVDVSRLHLILHISNTDCAGFFSITK